MVWYEVGSETNPELEYKLEVIIGLNSTLGLESANTD
jgi:hypothetical protein